MIIVQFFKYYASQILRQFIWMFRLLQSNLGNKVQLEFPIKRDGKGAFNVGNYSKIGRHTVLAIGQGGVLEFGANTVIQKESSFVINKDCKLITGSKFLFGAYSRFIVQNNWIFGERVGFGQSCSVFSREKGLNGRLIIGSGTYIGDNTLIDVSDDINIGQNVAIGPNCTLYTHDHDYTNSSLPAWHGTCHTGKIEIEEGAWIGANVTILAGVKIGKRAVVASGSIVNKNVDAESVVGGVPAKLIKKII